MVTTARLAPTLTLVAVRSVSFPRHVSPPFGQLSLTAIRFLLTLNRD